MRVVGDVHGYYKRYIELVSQVEYSVQLGDVGFNYSSLSRLDHTKHRFIPGNHDNYDHLPPHSLYNSMGKGYGWAMVGWYQFYFIRGGYSVDWKYRLPGVSVWDNEEISWQEGYEVIQDVCQVRPEIILSHECPFVVLPDVVTNPYKLDPSRTCQILDEVYKIHKPKLWVFGHHHHNWRKTIDRTTFICLDELSYLDLETII
jgi:predicted phosphodiesterase